MAEYIYRMRGFYSTTGELENWDSRGAHDYAKAHTGLPDPENISDVLVERRITIPATTPGDAGSAFSRPQLTVDAPPTFTLVDISDNQNYAPGAGAQMSLYTWP